MNPVFDNQAEEAVLGCCLLSETALGEIIPMLRAQDFYMVANGRIFDHIVNLDLEGGKVDSMTLTAALQTSGALEGVGGAAFVFGLTAAVPAASNARAYAQIVSDRARTRNLQTAAMHIQDLQHKGLHVDEQERQALAVLEAALDDNPVMSNITTAENALAELDDELREVMRTGTRIMGLPTGLNAYDALTYGLHPGQLIIVAARPSMGKTAFAFQAALHIAENGGVVSVHSVEMSQRELMMRGVSIYTGLDLQTLMVGILSPDMMPAYERGFERMRALAPRLLLDDRGTLSAVDIKQTCRGIRRRFKTLQLVVVDYIQLMQGHGRASNKNEEVSEITRALKVLAKDLTVPIIAISQLNRNVESRSDKRPQLHDLRDSGSVEQDADVVALMYRDDYYHRDGSSEMPGTVEMRVAKQRNGPLGMNVMPFAARTASFRNQAGSTSPHPPAAVPLREGDMPF